MQHSWIRSFHYAAKRESIAEAAEELNVASSAISRQISELEKFYNVELFERGANRIKLTHLGLSLKKITDRYFEQEDLVRKYLDKIHDRGNRIINIGVEDIQSMKFLLLAFKSRYPTLKFRIYADNQLSLRKMFLRGKLDLVASYDRERIADANKDGVETHFIRSESLKFVCSKDFKDKIPRGTSLDYLLSNYPFVVRTKDSLTRHIFDDLCIRKNLRPAVDFEVSTRDGVIEMVRSGAGIGTVIGSVSTRYKDISEISFAETDSTKQLTTVHMHVLFYARITTHNFLTNFVKGLQASISDT